LKRNENHGAEDWLVIVMVGNTKGGVGKTTLAVQLAIARARAGRDVWLIDGDRQGTAAIAIQERSERDQKPGVACGHYPEGKQLRAQVKQQQDKFEDIIIDVGGRDSTALRAALMLADVALVPFAPMSFDLWAMNDMAKVIEEINGEREGLLAYAVMNQAEPRETSADNAEAAEAVKGIEQFRYLATPLRKRKAFSAASSTGLSVAEMPVTDPKAVAEMDRLVQCVFNLEIMVN
jgi:chromosome partitioning protein